MAPDKPYDLLVALPLGVNQ